MDKSAARHADQHGCWPYRHVRKILDESGLVIGIIEVLQFGTLFYVEARPGPKQVGATKRDELEHKSNLEHKDKGAERWLGLGGE